jgi:two-component system chemotaxis response regulator CheB
MQPAEHRAPKRILIVDDSAPFRKCLHNLLESEHDLQICGEAENGYEGIEKAKEVRPDLIVLDFSMPHMNGIEAASHLKQLMPSVPLVMFTSFAGPQIEREATAVGISTVRSKDEDAQLLVGSIRTILDNGYKTAGSNSA